MTSKNGQAAYRSGVKNHYSETRVEVRLSLPENVDYYKKLQYQIISEQSYPNGEDSWYTMSKSV
ncbi:MULTISPECIES: hypothetical protein [unclassified Paenibacillus]|uniref:hypothetical protein n=1 Tax=unclassified Paenibacillus TaxID=185978 RepID=UPI0036457DE0